MKKETHVSTFIFVLIRWRPGRGREKSIWTQGPGSFFLQKKCQVKKAAMHGADELARGLSLTAIDRQPRMTPEFFPGCFVIQRQAVPK